MYSDLKMSHVTLTFEVWIRVMVTEHRLNEDNICNKLDDNPSLHTLFIVRTRNVTDGQTDEWTDKVHSYYPFPIPLPGIKNDISVQKLSLDI